MAPPLPLQNAPHRLADYLPIRGQRIRSPQDCAQEAVAASMRAHPRQLLDLPVMRIHFSTTCPSLIPLLLLLDLILNPGIIRQRQGIFPTALNLPGACCKRRLPSGLQAP